MWVTSRVSACCFLLLFVGHVGGAPQQSLREERLTSPVLDSLRVTAEGYLRQKPSEIRAGTQVNFIAKLSWQGKLDAVKVRRPEIPELEGFRYLYLRPASGIEPEAGKAWAEFDYSLEPVQKGQARISAMRINYTISATGERGELETEPLELQVLAAPRDWGKLLSYGAAGVACILAVGGGMMFFLKRRRRQTTVEREIVVSPYEQLKEELSSIHSYLVEGEIKTFYDRLVSLTKQTVSLEAREETGHLTTEEMASYLEQKEFDEGFQRRILSILEQSDKVRYAGYIPAPPESELVVKELEEILKEKLKESKTNKTIKEDQE